MFDSVTKSAIGSPKASSSTKKANLLSEAIFWALTISLSDEINTGWLGC
jgi:hypothetical protein